MRVVDVFIPRKMSLNGRKFGFVRFSGLNEARRVVAALSRAWLFNFYLLINMARFNTMSKFWRKVDQTNIVRGNHMHEKMRNDNGKFGCSQENNKGNTDEMYNYVPNLCLMKGSCSQVAPLEKTHKK
ncbi:hypothetical protein REPUB_Repub01dG0033600 [Reevesia pubescens]